MVELRPYQRELLDQAEIGLAVPNSRVMVQLPTGGGKTHIASSLLAGWLLRGAAGGIKPGQGGGKAVWLTHRRELSDQTCLVLNDSGVTATNRLLWEVDDPAPALRGGVVILMAQTVSRRNRYEGVWKEYGPNDLLVIDEAHHATAAGWERAIIQWPGRVVGLTATPWRLSKTEGFDHLFGELYCGPQVSQLQAEGWLCQARVLMPQPEDIIRGGIITSTGDYNESGIEEANRDRPGVMTAGALHFWQNHASERQTIIYAVSKGHANNLTTVFNDAGIPAAVILSDTPSEERARAIESFGNGTLQVLVNVAVVTEGFDLPDAACVVLTRPTMSLALYLQMVGRGLRPKADGGDCLILDLAGNAERHGLPEDNRHCSLRPRGRSDVGEMPGVWCEMCNGVSPAASHFCKHCDAPFGQDCGRCGKWRADKRWILAERCSHSHDVVCDSCHLDAHIAANLPESQELVDSAIDPLLSRVVDEVRRSLLSENDARQKELSELIDQWTRENSNGADLDHLFDVYISSLPIEERPTSNRAIGIALNSWEIQRQEDLRGWIEERVMLRSRTLIEDNVRRECYEQLERAGIRDFYQAFRHLSYDELIAEFDEWLRRDFNKYFLNRLLYLEEHRRTFSQSERDEHNDLTSREYRHGYRQLSRRLDQLNRRLDQAMHRRLRTMKRQFERRWKEIWEDCQQSSERE